jgi:hypothetical protein
MHTNSYQCKLAAAFEAAMEFGLSDEDVWDTAKAVARRGPKDASLDDWFGELVEALAGRIEATL